MSVPAVLEFNLSLTDIHSRAGVLHAQLYLAQVVVVSYTGASCAAGDEQDGPAAESQAYQVVLQRTEQADA